MSKHHKIQFKKKKKIKHLYKQIPSELVLPLSSVKTLGFNSSKQLTLSAASSSFLPQPLVLFLMINSKLGLSNVKKILSKCARDQNIWKCISTSLENKYSSAYSCIYGWVGTVASELKTLIFIYFTSEIQFPVIHFTDKIHKTWFSWFLLCLCSHNIWAIPEDSVAGEGRKSEGEDGIWVPGKGQGRGGLQNKDRNPDFILSARENKIWGFQQESDQFTSIFVISFAMHMTILKTELLGFCKICLKGHSHEE